MTQNLDFQPDHKQEELHNGTDEGQLYLRVAELVLKQSSIALSAKEIKERGIEKGFFGDHTFGNTPEKSMQARLSTDILNKKPHSLFVRTARGRFFFDLNLSRRMPAVKISQNRSMWLLEEYSGCPAKRCFQSQTKTILDI